MRSNDNLSRVLALAFCCSVAIAQSLAQAVGDPQSNSPFSRFGLGDLTPLGYATQTAMGGIGQGYSDAYIPNPLR